MERLSEGAIDLNDRVMIKGYKVFNLYWYCRGFKYKVGETYEHKYKPIVCSEGFHFCKRAADCFNYYDFDPRNKVAEIIALGDIAEEGDKCSTNKIQIVREITWEELLNIVNTGRNCTGIRNTGDLNSGHCNTGNSNSGRWNTGNDNKGSCNTGNYNRSTRNTGNHNSDSRNSGDCNSGTQNTGNYNSGNWNTGDYNIGDWNTGDNNSGLLNSGHFNSGSLNVGNYNRGNHNVGDWNNASNTIGCFNTEPQELKFFDKKTNMTLDEWRDSEARQILNNANLRPTTWVNSTKMSDYEKLRYIEHETTGGYLKKNDLSKCYKVWWKNLPDDKKQIILDIPNFDAKKFSQITGINVEDIESVWTAKI